MKISHFIAALTVIVVIGFIACQKPESTDAAQPKPIATVQAAAPIELEAPALIAPVIETHSVWIEDFDKAKKQAKAENKYMLVDFTGSDWCGWCIKLNNEVFTQKEFLQYAQDNLVLVELDFPRGKPQSAEIKKQNNELATKYGVRGFPTILILDPNGELVAKTGYQKGGPVAYIEHIKGLIAKAS